jgi:hypothetical protein
VVRVARSFCQNRRKLPVRYFSDSLDVAEANVRIASNSPLSTSASSSPRSLNSPRRAIPCQFSLAPSPISLPSGAPRSSLVSRRALRYPNASLVKASKSRSGKRVEERVAKAVMMMTVPEMTRDLLQEVLQVCQVLVLQDQRVVARHRVLQGYGTRRQKRNANQSSPHQWKGNIRKLGVRLMTLRRKGHH